MNEDASDTTLLHNKEIEELKYSFYKQKKLANASLKFCVLNNIV